MAFVKVLSDKTELGLQETLFEVRQTLRKAQEAIDAFKRIAEAVSKAGAEK